MPVFCFGIYIFFKLIKSPRQQIRSSRIKEKNHRAPCKLVFNIAVRLVAELEALLYEFIIEIINGV